MIQAPTNKKDSLNVQELFEFVVVCNIIDAKLIV